MCDEDAPDRELTPPPPPWRNPKVITSVASGVLLLAGWLLGLAGAPGTASTALYVAAIGIGGYFFGREALEELVFEREIGIELLMSAAALVAAVMGQTAEGAILVFLYSISEAAEGYTEEKTRAAIRALMDLTPKVALVRREGRDVEIPAGEVAVGDVFVVKPGQAVVTDGEIVSGRSALNQAAVTGESLPVDKGRGDPVFAGSLNGQGALEVRATRTFADNTIARIIQMVEEARDRKGKSQRFIERFGNVYSPAVLAAGILIAALPPLLLGAAWATWITRATVFIVAAAPCALVISIPITLVAALGTGARSGVLIKGGIYLEELARIKVVALDKTGTITRGEPEVTDVLPFPGQRPARELIAVAAGIESRSAHPLARAIMRNAETEGIAPAPVTDVRALAGAGVTGVLDGAEVYVASPAYFLDVLGAALDGNQADVSRLHQEGKTVLLVGGRTPWGLIAVRDAMRPDAVAAVEALHALGMEVAMLTGDNPVTAKAIAQEVGIDRVHAHLKPEDKVACVRDLSQTLGYVAMVGDGVNDAPALAAATVGVAMGAIGSDVALETADVALMADDLRKLEYAFNLAKRNQAIVRQNLVLSALVIGVLVAGAIAGAFNLPVAVLGHELSEFLVIASGLRMLRA